MMKCNLKETSSDCLIGRQYYTSVRIMDSVQIQTGFLPESTICLLNWK